MYDIFYFKKFEAMSQVINNPTQSRYKIVQEKRMGLNE